MPKHNQTTSNFGIGKLMLRLGVATTPQKANQIGNLVLLAVVVVLFGAMYVLNFGSRDSVIEDKYYYDPTQNNDAG